MTPLGRTVLFAVAATVGVGIGVWALPGPGRPPTVPPAYDLVGEAATGPWCSRVEAVVGPGRAVGSVRALVAAAGAPGLALGAEEADGRAVAALALVSAPLVPRGLADEWPVLRAALHAALDGRPPRPVAPAGRAAVAVDRELARC